MISSRKNIIWHESTEIAHSYHPFMKVNMAWNNLIWLLNADKLKITNTNAWFNYTFMTGEEICTIHLHLIIYVDLMETNCLQILVHLAKWPHWLHPVFYMREIAITMIIGNLMAFTN